MSDPHIVFAQVLAHELDVSLTKDFIAACDRVLMRLWIEGYKLAPVDVEVEANAQ